MTQQKQILVAGGAGFIGFHLCRALLQAGHGVVALDNFSSGQRQSAQALSAFPNFRLIEADIAVPLPQLPRTQEVYNLACPASPPHYQKDPVQTWKTSVFGTYHLLQYAKDCGARFFQASTSEVYGDPEIHPQKEDYVGHVNPIGPRACYDEGKRAAEALCFDFHRHHKLTIRVARIFNSYGPYMRLDDGRVVTNFIGQALRGMPLTVYGDGRQTRSFCYIDDLIMGMTALMGCAMENPVPVNLGNPDEFTMLQLAEAVKKLCRSDAPLKFMSLPQDDPKQRCPDISRAKNILRWQPLTPLESGLRQTIEYFKPIISAEGKIHHAAS